MTDTAAKSRRKKLIYRIIGWCATGLLTIAVCVCLFVTVQILTKGYVSVGGYSFFRIVTGSMEPTMPVGSLTLTKQQDITDVKKGDVVTFKSQSSETHGKIITHRVVDVFTSNNDVILQTKGDANLSTDSNYVKENNYIGTVIWCSGDSGFCNFIAFFTNKYSFVVAIAIPCLLIAGIILSSCVSKMRKDVMAAMDELAADEKKDNADTEEGKHEETEEEMIERLRKEILEEMNLSEKRE